MVLDKRYCVEYEDGAVRCYGDDGFWYTDVSSPSCVLARLTLENQRLTSI
jgi:hypothetical protein